MVNDTAELTCRETGRIGGLRTLERHGVEHFKRIHKLGKAGREQARLRKQAQPLQEDLDIPEDQVPAQFE